MTRPDGGGGNDALSPGSPVCGRYRIERELGRGGMATVYLARDLRHDRMVALKMLHPELSGALGTDRFLREISIAARLQHPNILPLFDSGTTTDLGGGEARSFYVMPYVAGESLRARLQRETQLGLEEAIRICRQIAAALDYAHGQGIVHRDIKPENILLEAERAVVADFGVATALDAAGGEKLTQAGIWLGTPAYMSPEQATAKRVDARSDVYSLACVLYETLVGDPPFLGSSARAVMARHALDPVPSVRTARPEIPDHLEAALRRGLAKVPGDRFASAGEFAAAVAGSGPVAGASAPARTRGLRLAAALALGGLGRIALWQWRPTPAPAPAVSPGGRVRALRFVVAAVLLVAGAAIAWTRGGWSGQPVARLPRPIVALPPLVNATGDTALDYLAVGLSEAISGRLASSGRVAVAGRGDAFSQAALGPILDEGRARGADAILAGRLLRQQGVLALDVELFRVSDGARIWSERLALPLRDVLLVEDRVTQGVLVRLDTLRRTGTPKARSRPVDSEAHLLLLRAWYAAGERTTEGFRRARDLFLLAIQRDPVYAEAYAGLSASYHGLAHYGAMSGREALPRARAAALRALEIDSTLAQARTGVAAVRTFYDWDWASAERDYQEALRMDPRDPVTHNFYGIHLRILGRFDEAARQMDAASRLDPLARIYVRQLGLVHFCAGNYAAALTQFRRALDMDPEYQEARRQVVATLAQQGQFDAALDEWRRATEGLPAELRQVLASARGARGYRQAIRVQAHIDLDQLRVRALRGYVAPTGFAEAHARLEQWDSALAWLERAADDRDPGVLKIACGPDYRPLATDPRYQQLVRRLGLPSGPD